jgi:ankyrin repeat protein
MKKTLLFKLLFIFVLIICAFLLVHPGFAQEFSAQIKISQPEETYIFDYFVKDHLYRLEGKDSSGEPFVIIVDRQKNTYIGIHPIMKFYMEFSKEAMLLFNPLIGWEMITQGKKEEKMGTEVLAGIVCEKYIYTEPGMTESGTEVWYSPELKQRLKIIVPLINSGQGIFELINIKVTKQDEEKFKVPEGYQKMESPEEQAGAEKEKPATSTTASEPLESETKIEQPIPQRELSKEEIKQLNQDIIQNNLVTVHKVLASGVDASLLVASTESMLMSACAYGTPDMVSLVLDYHPDINYQDIYGNNALTKAVGNFDHYRQMVPMLLNVGVNPNSNVGSSGKINYTALYKITNQALQTQDEIDYDIMCLFLEKGANPNLADKNSKTPLMNAAYKGNLAIVKMLLEFHADPTLKDYKGQSSLDMAQKKGHQDVIQLLNQ